MTVLPGWAVLTAVLAGLAVFLVVPPRSRRVPGRPAARPTPDDSALGRLLRGRPGAVPLDRRVLVGVVTGIAAGVLVARLGSPAAAWAVAPVVAAVVAVAPGWLEPAAVRRRRHQLVLQTPQALELLASCLAAGMPVRRAVAAVVDAFDGPLAEDLGRVAQLGSLGTGDTEAWQALADHPQLGPAASDGARSVDSGTLLVEGLRHHARRAREQRLAALQVRARSVGVRSVLPLMCCFIPSFVLLGVVPSVASSLSRALHL